MQRHTNTRAIQTQVLAVCVKVICGLACVCRSFVLHLCYDWPDWSIRLLQLVRRCMGRTKAPPFVAKSTAAHAFKGINIYLFINLLHLYHCYSGAARRCIIPNETELVVSIFILHLKRKSTLVISWRSLSYCRLLYKTSLSIHNSLHTQSKFSAFYQRISASFAWEESGLAVTSSMLPFRTSKSAIFPDNFHQTLKVAISASMVYS